MDIYVELCGGKSWLVKQTSERGDPERTCLKASARRFPSVDAAKREIKKACKTHPCRKSVDYAIIVGGGVVFEYDSVYGSCF